MQRDLWDKEYRENRNWPSSYRKGPSKVMVEFFSEKHEVSGPALDVGSGFGRNSIHLAKQGLEVVGIEIVGYAIGVAKERAIEARVLEKITFIEQSVADRLSYPNNHFGLIIDMMSMHLLNKVEREKYGKQVSRLLKPGGYFVFYTISAESPEARRLTREFPGPEPDSYKIPQNGMIEHSFTENELLVLFSPLKFIKFKRLFDKTEFKGKVYEREYYSGVMMK